MATLVCL